MQRELVRRVRWDNVGRAAAAVAVGVAVVAWPRLGPTPPRVPSGAAVPIVAGPGSPPARRRVTPTPIGAPRETARIARRRRRAKVMRRRGQALRRRGQALGRRGQAARPARPRPAATPTAAARPRPAATPTAAARPRPAATPTATPAHTPSKRRPVARRRRPSPADEFGFER
jgi:hypothetical protein